MAKKKAAARKGKTKRTAKQVAATRKMLAANKRKRGGKKAKARTPKPTKFQRFIMKNPDAAAKKMGWKL